MVVAETPQQPEEGGLRKKSFLKLYRTLYLCTSSSPCFMFTYFSAFMCMRVCVW